MNTKRCYFTILCITLFSMHKAVPHIHSPESKAMLLGTVQFPHTIQTVPDIRIYYSGHKITSEENATTKQLLFSIPKLQQTRKFFVVITEKLQFELEENTVKHIKLPNNTPYKFYELTLVEQERDSTEKNPLDNKYYTWQIQEQRLSSPVRHIPDETIIICLPPEYVDHLSGGNSIELPHIILKDSLLTIVGSEAELHDRAARLLLSALNYDTLHAKVNQEVKNIHPSKTIIACRTP